MTETEIMRRSMVLAAKIGVHLFRNNCGQYKTDAGHWIRFGIANPGGSDTIGWRSITVTQDMVGKQIAQFVAVEFKSKSKLTKEQQAFLDIVNECGGIGIKASSVEEALLPFSSELKM